MSYLVSLDKPVGIAVYFRPELSWDDVEDVIVILDDKSQDAMVFALPVLYEALHGDGRQIEFFAILQGQPDQPIKVYNKDVYPEPHLLIWRSQEEFRDWYNGYNGQTVVDRPK